MLSLISHTTRMRSRTRKQASLKFKGVVKDVVVVAICDEPVTDKLLNQWRACEGVLKVECLDRRHRRPCVEIVVDGSIHESGWKRHFGTADKRKLPQAVVDTLNAL